MFQQVIKTKVLQPLLLLAITILLTSCQSPMTLAWFKSTHEQCFDRQTRPHTMVVDSHNHFRPFGGPALDYQRLTGYFADAGVLFVNVYGIGQTLPVNAQCHYPAQCPQTPITPNINNDIINAQNYLKYPRNDIHLTLAMTFADLSKPQTISTQIRQFEQDYPGVFRWMGEVNLVKQALFSHGQYPTTSAQISQWGEFMGILRNRNIPIAIHSDIGNDKTPTKYLDLFDQVLQDHPNNPIVWMHMGLSKEQLSLDVTQHIQIIQQRLDRYPNLTVDISWQILHDHYFNSSQHRQQYIELFNQYPSRFLPGTDFIAYPNKKAKHYRQSVKSNSKIFRYLNNQAFRHIVLGQNYFNLLSLDFQAPKLCP